MAIAQGDEGRNHDPREKAGRELHPTPAAAPPSRESAGVPRNLVRAHRRQNHHDRGELHVPPRFSCSLWGKRANKAKWATVEKRKGYFPPRSADAGIDSTADCKICSVLAIFTPSLFSRVVIPGMQPRSSQHHMAGRQSWKCPAVMTLLESGKVSCCIQ